MRSVQSIFKNTDPLSFMCHRVGVAVGVGDDVCVGVGVGVEVGMIVNVLVGVEVGVGANISA